jgi:arylsulfatase A-like enzyme
VSQRADGLTRRTFVKGSAALTVLSQLAACGNAPRSKGGPNILLVLSDAHRASSMGCYGEDQIRTPRFDAFAREGLKLDTAVSSTPLCRPFRASLMTGAYAHHHGMFNNSPPRVPEGNPRRTSDRNFGVDDFDQWRPGSLPTLGETFARAGYRCGYIGKWHLGNAKVPRGKLRFGFDDYWAVGATPKHDYWRARYLTDDLRMVRDEGTFVPTLETDLALEFIEAADERPWLLILAWGPPHGPFEPPEEFQHYAGISAPPNVPAEKSAQITKRTLPLYYGLIEAIDHEFGRLVDGLDTLGGAEQTLVVYTSDHGAQLQSHGLSGKEVPYSESTRVPFLLRWPGQIPSGASTGMPFGSPDIFPTLAGLVGVPAPGGMDGTDLSDALRGTPGAARQQAAYLAAHEPSGEPWPGWRGVRTERYLYARREDAPWLLIDVAADPFEQNNLIGSDPDLQAEMDTLTNDLMRQVGDSWRGS